MKRGFVRQRSRKASRRSISGVEARRAYLLSRYFGLASLGVSSIVVAARLSRKMDSHGSACQRRFGRDVVCAKERVVVVGAGIGGLAAAVELAAEGLGVTVVEKHGVPGGKMREVDAGGARIDAGPTVFTMRDVFEGIFEKAGASLSRLFDREAGRRARPSRLGGGRRTRPFRRYGEDGGRHRRLRRRGRCARIPLFLQPRRRTSTEFWTAPSSARRSRTCPALMWRIGLLNFDDLWRINPYQSFWNAVCRHMSDARLRQLFARYSTYCGASPFSAPATLMLVAHVEQRGVWLVEGGMHRIALALESLARKLGAVFRYGVGSRRGAVGKERRVAASGSRDGERLQADAVVLNADVSAVSAGAARQGRGASGAADPAAQALAFGAHFCLSGGSAGLPARAAHGFLSKRLLCIRVRRHIQAKKAASFACGLFCAQDRDDGGGGNGEGAERFLGIVNAPAQLDAKALSQSEIEECETKTFRLMEACGLTLRPVDGAMARTAPQDFERLFPGTGGAIYGRASHGWMASFQRQGIRSRDAGPLLRGGQRASGAGHSDGGAFGAARVGSVARRLGFDESGCAKWLRLVVYRCVQRRPPLRTDDHRLYRQRVLALLRQPASQPGEADPAQHCSLNVAVYGQGVGRWAMTERCGKALRPSADGLRIGPSSRPLGRDAASHRDQREGADHHGALARDGDARRRRSCPISSPISARAAVTAGRPSRRAPMWRCGSSNPSLSGTEPAIST